MRLWRPKAGNLESVPCQSANHRIQIVRYCRQLTEKRRKRQSQTPVYDFEDREKPIACIVFVDRVPIDVKVCVRSCVKNDRLVRPSKPEQNSILIWLAGAR